MKKKNRSFQLIFFVSILLLFFSGNIIAQDTTSLEKNPPDQDTTIVSRSTIAVENNASKNDTTIKLEDSALVQKKAFRPDTTIVSNNTNIVEKNLYKHDSTIVGNNAFTRDTIVNNDAKSVIKDPVTSHLKAINNGYYTTYPDEFILRIYLKNKFGPFTISSSNKEDLNYKSNSKLGAGAGFTYKALTLNLAYGFNFLNPEDGKGKTKGLDLQIHLYPKKWAIDLIGAFLKGYYLDPKDYNGLHLNNYYLRPDLSRNIVGLAIYRVANGNKFSYRAAFNQKDWQTRSAGSLLFGGETYYGVVKSDSSLVPLNAGPDYLQAGINNINSFSIGPGIGYAYTLVLGNHFFITGSAIASINLNISQEENGTSINSVTKILPGADYKAAIGYNSNTWSFTAAFLGDALYAGSAISKKEYFLPTGNVNFVIAKKFGTTRK